MEAKPNPEEKNIPSLSQFLEDNQKLISVLGVFNAITVFSLSLPYKKMSLMLSFAFLSITIIIWIELWAKFPRDTRVTTRLSIFENILSYSLLLLVVYWFFAYKEIFIINLHFIIWLIIISVLAHLIKTMNLFQPINKNSNKSQSIRIIFGIIVIVFTWYLSSIISPIIIKNIKAIEINNITKPSSND
jgi:hypothetical protein